MNNIMKKFITILIWVLIIILIIIATVCMFYPMRYHFDHDQLTQMQLFKRFWYLYIIGFGSLLSVLIIYENGKNNKEK